jgi:hypothetical protein
MTRAHSPRSMMKAPGAKPRNAKRIAVLARTIENRQTIPKEPRNRAERRAKAADERRR